MITIGEGLKMGATPNKEEKKDEAPIALMIRAAGSARTPRPAPALRLHGLAGGFGALPAFAV